MPYALGGQAEQGRGQRKPLLLAIEASNGAEAGEREERPAGPGESQRAARCASRSDSDSGFSPNIYAEYGRSRGSWI